MSELFPENIRKVGLFPLSLGDQGKDYFATALKRLDDMGVNYVVSLPEGGEYRFFAGRDRERAASFNRLLADKSIDLLFAIRGGVGAVRTLDFIDWELLFKRNIPVVGYSDMTGFLLAAWGKGFKNGIAGRMAESSFGGALTPEEIACSAKALRDCVAGKVICPTDDAPLKAVKAGSVTAPVVPCCLLLLMSLIGTPWMPDLTGTILVIESIGTDEYQIERDLTQLEQCGILQSLGGLVFGTFLSCGSPKYLPEIFRDYAGIVPGPVCCSFKFGHKEPGAVIRVGGTATLTVSDTGAVSFA